jgi:hypothetical protein
MTFTCEKPAYCVLYLITFRFDSEQQVLVLYRNLRLLCFLHAIHMLRFRVQIKNAPGGDSEVYKRLDNVMAFTCEKPADCVLYLITFKFDGEHQVLVLHRNLRLLCFLHAIHMLRFRVQIKNAPGGDSEV